MATEDTKKAVRVLPFSRKDADWRMWLHKFLARARIKGYRGIIKGSETPLAAADILDPTDTQHAEPIRNRHANYMTYSDLLLACQDEVSFGVVNKAITTVLPDG